MAITHTFTYKFDNGSQVISQTVALSAGQQISIDESFANGAADVLVAVNIDISQLQSLFILADGVITIETNSSSAPDDTLLLAANKAVVWQKAQYTLDAAANENLFDADITALYVSNASGATVRLQIQALIDPTV